MFTFLLSTIPEIAPETITHDTIVWLLITSLLALIGWQLKEMTGAVQANQQRIIERCGSIEKELVELRRDLEKK